MAGNPGTITITAQTTEGGYSASASLAGGSEGTLTLPAPGPFTIDVSADTYGWSENVAGDPGVRVLYPGGAYSPGGNEQLNDILFRKSITVDSSQKNLHVLVVLSDGCRTYNTELLIGFTSSPTGSFTPPPSPNPCWGAAGGSCDSIISWTTSNSSQAEVFVDGGYLWNGVSGNQDYSAIPVGGSDTFDLYDYSSGSQGAHLAFVSVSGNPFPVNGTCGTANGQLFSAAPNSNLCAAGTASAVSGSGPWSWSCNGQYNGQDASCDAGTAQTGSCPENPNPPVFTFAANQGQDSPSQSFTVMNTSPSTVTASLSNLPAWLSADQSTISIPANGSGSFTLTASAVGLSPNLYGPTNFGVVLSGGTTLSCNQLVMANATLIVSANSPTLTSVTVSPANPPGIDVGQTQPYTATAHYSDGSSNGITDVALWSSSSMAVAQYVGGGSSPHGTFQGEGQGTTQVWACSPSNTTICGSATITINPPAVTCQDLTPNPVAGSAVSFLGGGGNGTYSWAAPNGSPNSGSGSGFTTQYSAAGTYRVTVTSGGSNDQCLVSVAAAFPPPTCAYFTSKPPKIVVPEKSNLEWSCSNVTTCSIQNDSNASQVFGPFAADAQYVSSSTLPVQPASTTQYTLTCIGIGGNADVTSSITTVTVQGTNERETNPGG